MKKIKVFLGGYINLTNAQNLNCLSIAKYLNKEKFEIYTMSLYSGNLNKDEYLNIKVYNVRYPYKFFRYFAYLWGIYNADVIFLPKREIPYWENFLLKLFGKRNKTFTTIEGILDDEAYKNLIKFYNNNKKLVLYSLFYIKNRYSITKFLKKYNEKKFDLKTKEKILYLGVDFEKFAMNKHRKELKNIIFIGSLIERKQPFQILELAKLFPNLNFHIVGDGEERIKIEKYINQKNLGNVRLYGKLSHDKLKQLFEIIDLHILPSKSEGFPKVILETASAGIPSVVYNTYGAEEWIENGKNGFVVSSFEEIIRVISDIKRGDISLENISENAVLLGKKFDWKNIVKHWEEEILKIYKGEI